MSQNPTSEKNELVMAIKEEHILVTPENKVTVHVGLANHGESDDYFDILVKGIPPDWVTVDTPVVHLAAGEVCQIMLTIQPPALLHSRVGQYPLDVQAVSQSDRQHSATAHSFVTVAAYHSGGRIGIALGSVYFSVVPGASVTVPLLLQNRGQREDVFQLSIEGLPANWISANAGFIRLEPSARQEVDITISVPRTSEATVGRTPFKIVIISQDFPDQKDDAECILTVAAFSKFSIALFPKTLRAGQAGHLTIYNEGNTSDAYSVGFHSPAGKLLFERQVPVRHTGTQPEVGYVPVTGDEKVHIEAGRQGVYSFRTQLKSPPLVGEAKLYPFTVDVRSAENLATDLPGEVSQAGMVPPWAIATLMVLPLILCFLFVLPPLLSYRGAQAAAHSTETAIAAETLSAATGTPADNVDDDADGLSNADEVTAGTDPINPDTDSDEILDGQETGITHTNPLVVDTDKDGLSDGDEVLRRKTNPLNVDTDTDSLPDGDEVARRTDPLAPDTDKDGLSDGVEVNLSSDPLQQDSDRDGLLDGRENQTCPNVLTPDTDGDGVLDGKDLEPCNPANPLWTATAFAAQTQSATSVPPTGVPPTGVPPTNAPPTAIPPTSVPPTAAPTITPLPTYTPLPTVTNPPPPTATATIPALQGVMLFESNRDGNPEIYAENLASQVLLRLTTNTAIDVQPVLAPDSSARVVYVSNQNGNNEIYLTGLNRQPPVNLTNNPSDDQQPAWSPDGKWIVFTSNRDGNQEIYIMNQSGGEVRNLTANAASDFAPTWFSIPGFLSLGTEEWIAFTSNRDGNQEVYRIRPDGTGLTNLTKNPANDYAPASFSSGQLAFVSDRDGNPEIYTATSDGGSPTNITNSFGQDLSPVFSPDGKWIAFSSDRDGNFEIYVVELATGRVYNITRSPAQDTSPDW